MTWLRLQWRGALVALIAWAGLAAAQAPVAPQGSPYLPSPPVSQAPPTALPPAAPPPTALPPITSVPGSPAKAPSAPAPGVQERLVTVHENDKSTRCRIVQSWKLSDGSTAQQLQAVDTGEYITIVDDLVTPSQSSRGIAKRIFHWGLFNRTPPPGTPLPPELLQTGAVVTQSTMPTIPPGPNAARPGPQNNCCDCAPGTMANGACANCEPGTMIVLDGNGAGELKLDPPPAPTLVGRMRSWFAKTQPQPGAEVKIVAPTPLQSPSGSLAINAAPPVNPLPSAARPEQVAPAPSPLTSTQKAFIGLSTPAPSDVALIKPTAPLAPLGTAKAVGGPGKTDILTQPEKFTPSDDKLNRNMAKMSGQPIPTGAVLPPGASSVIAARNGMDGPIAYVPIQPVVVPKPWRPPVPPDPKVPEAPQLNAFVNAFSAPTQADGPTGDGFVNAFGNGTMNTSAPYRPMMPPYAMPNPYGVPPYGMNPAMAPQGMPYGYNPMAYGNYPMPYGYNMMPNGYPMMPPTAAVDPRRSYQGPLPPDPFGTGGAPLVQVGYAQQASPYPQQPYAPQGYPAPTGMPMPMQAPVNPAPQAAPQIGQLVDMLHDSPYPAQRELAANLLAACDWRANPKIAAELVNAAKQDPAPTVRAGCIGNLMRMNVTSDAFRHVLDEMQTDADPRVREAVEQAVQRLSQARTARNN